MCRKRLAERLINPTRQTRSDGSSSFPLKPRSGTTLLMVSGALAMLDAFTPFMLGFQELFKALNGAKASHLEDH